MILIPFFSGCVNYAKFKIASQGLQKKDRGQITLMKLFDNWDKYHVYYNSNSGWIRGLMFDPKDNDKNLTGDSWTKAESKDQMLSRIKQRDRHKYGTLYSILDKDDQFYGYIYLTKKSRSAIAKKVNENTFFVYDVSSQSWLVIAGP